MALDSPQEIFDESELSDCGSMVVEPPTSPRSWSLASTPSPAPHFPTTDAAPALVADGPGRHEDEATRKFSTPDRDPASENEASTEGASPENEMPVTLPPLALLQDQHTSPTMPGFPSQPFPFDFVLSQLTASPDEVESTQKRSRDDFEADLGTIIDTELFGDQGLGIWVPEETEGAPTVIETDRPEVADGQGDERREAKSPRPASSKRRKL